MDTNDVKMLYDAFITLCDHVEESKDSCSVCPMRDKVCFNGEKGHAFAEALQRIREQLGMR